MRSIRGGTLGWNIEIYSTPTNQFDWSVPRAYVINIAYYTSKSGIWLVISWVASYFHEQKASANTAYEWNNMAIFHDECNKWFILYFIFSCCLARCCHSGPDSYNSISRYAYRGISAHIPRRDLVIFCVLRSHWLPLIRARMEASCETTGEYEV